MFGLPAPSPYDLRFRLFQVPVTVSPYFWLTSLLLVGFGDGLDPRTALIWVGCVFVSILVHEFGHALTAKAFGFRPQVVLYGMGGLCASEAERQTFGQRLAVLIMGPGAQLLLLGLLVLASRPLLGLTPGSNAMIGRHLLGLPPGGTADDTLRLARVANAGDSPSWEIYWSLFQINWLWPLLNLLPIWPLDGGPIAGELLGKANPTHGKRWGHIVSMLTAGLIAAYTLAQSKGHLGGNLFRILFFAYFAFINYQMLQLYHQQFHRRGPDDDPEWWTRNQ
jgi:Zn-dependent protease